MPHKDKSQDRLPENRFIPGLQQVIVTSIKHTHKMVLVKPKNTNKLFNIYQNYINQTRLYYYGALLYEHTIISTTINISKFYPRIH